MATPLNTQQLVAFKPALGQKNVGDPRSAAAVADFSAGGTLHYTVDMTQLQNAGTIGGIKCVYVDNSANAQVLTIVPSVAGMTLKCPANCQGFFPVLAPTPAQFDISMTGGTAKSTVIFLDFEVPYQVWNTAGLNSLIFNGSGYVLVSDAVLDACVSGNRVAVVNSDETSGAVVNSRITLTQTIVNVTATSGALIAANASRKALRWMNVGGSDVTVVPGSSAAVAGNGMIYQGQGVGLQGSSESFDAVVPTNAFQCICAAGKTSTLVVWEG